MRVGLLPILTIPFAPQKKNTMPGSKIHLSRFSAFIWLTLAMFLVFAATFVAYVRAEKRIDLANEFRQRSFLLAQELRQSSDDLTRMVRTYVVTGDPIYKKHYQEILDIRDGRKPRPVDYQGIYWDLVLADDHRPRPMGPALPLLELMKRAGFTEAEFATLAKAKANSDALTRTEFAAMKLIEAATPPTETDRAKAIRTLYDSSYHRAKAGIMGPIDQFYRMSDRRTEGAVLDAQAYATRMRLALVLAGVLLVVLLWSARRNLTAVLGGTLGDVYEGIVRLGSGDFSTGTPVAKGMEDSVLGWLSETRIKLAEIDSEGQRSNREQQRLNRALRLLSDCNLALIHEEDEQALLSNVCRRVVETGGYLMAWIGFAEQDAGKSVRPVAQFGYGEGYLEGVRISWDEVPEVGHGPTGSAIRTGTTQINQNWRTNPKMAPWREDAAKRGYQSSIAVPLVGQEKILGALTLYSAHSDAFNAEEVALLEELARNLAFGIEALRSRRERKQAEDDLRIAATAFESQEGMMITDANGVILRVNLAFIEGTGYTAEEVVGQTPRLFKSDRHNAAFYAALWESLRRTGRWQGEIWDRRKSGEVYPKWLTISAVTGHAGAVTHYVSSHIDITQRKAAEDQLHRLAFYDPLTQLPNRRLLLDRLAHALAGSARSRRQGAIMFLDLDNFKTLNETQGHDTGDCLLAQAAQRLQSSVRQGDTVARLGGDEFVVMLEDLEDDDLVAAQVEGVAENILAAFDRPYRLEVDAASGVQKSIDHRCTASIGVTLFGPRTENVDELLKQADLAMYQAKDSGRNTIRFFDPDMQATVAARVANEADLREAVLKRQFLLHYQPQVAGDGHRLTGVEALVRWQHPQRGLVSPAEFIPLAEETGVIQLLGNWVLMTACAQLAAWANQPEMAHLTVAVNVSARQFHHDDFVDQVLAVLGQTGADPQRLKLELTESLLVSNVEGVIAKMSLLKAKGVGFSLDDFGTGYSSLSYLKRLPLDQLKIDQSFVRDVLTDPNDAAIAKMIIALSDNLGLSVIAEGVETDEQRKFLAANGCHAYQGFLFSVPLPLEDFESLARSA
ncbi:MAG TPA: EAL domain-containing protein [Rhodocyclaceae bacterium]|nr:EAL domain-containing protein [Rhodocyclaceae bacterium]